MCGIVATWGAELIMFEPNNKVLPNIKAIWEANKLPVAKIYYGFASNVTIKLLKEVRVFGEHIYLNSK